MLMGVGTYQIGGKDFYSENKIFTQISPYIAKQKMS